MFQACLGCANFWDEITDHNFEVSQLWNKPNPYLVLKDSSDGTKRAKAFRALHEPSQDGGSREDQDTIVKILTTGAVAEHTAVARMAAIESLSKFKDPRAADALIAAYYAADRYRTTAGDDVKYSSEMTNMLRCQSLRALGRQGDPKAVQHLVTVLRQPPARGAEGDKQMVMDERIAAARALAKFHDPRAEEALLSIMKTEKDIALKDCAHESLQVATGKKWPQDSPEWESVVNPGAQPAAVAVQSQPKPVPQQTQPVLPAAFRPGLHPGSQTVQPGTGGAPAANPLN
jgi:HEAT repeat protein